MKQFVSIKLILCMLVGICTADSGTVSSSQNTLPSGLHYTQKEIGIWRERVKNKKPYYNEWQRVKANAERFRAEPSRERHFGYTDSGCVPRMYKEGDVEALDKGDAIRDAAFVSLVLNDSDLRAGVIRELLEQIKEPGVDFSNEQKWCNEHRNRILDRNPGFANAEWATRLLFAYDYVRHHATAGERKKLDQWFYETGKFFQKNVNHDRELFYEDRDNGVLSKFGESKHNKCNEEGRRTHLDGPVHCGMGGLYNNRMAHQVRLVALIGLQQNIEAWKRFAKLWTKEYVRYHVYPEIGGFSEFHRGSLNNPESGLQYSHQTLGDMLDVADHFARTGDTELYDYNPDTEIPNQTGKVSLKHAIDFMINISEGELNIYVYEGGQRKVEYKMDGVGSTGYAPRDLWFAQYNIYFQDPKITTAYTREIGPNNRHGQTRLNSADFVWMGAGRAYPSKLFMFGQMEGKVWPY